MPDHVDHQHLAGLDVRDSHPAHGVGGAVLFLHRRRLIWIEQVGVEDQMDAVEVLDLPRRSPAGEVGTVNPEQRPDLHPQASLLDQLASQRAARLFTVINTAAGQRPRANVMPTGGDPGEQHFVSTSYQGARRESQDPRCVCHRMPTVWTRRHLDASSFGRAVIWTRGHLDASPRSREVTQSRARSTAALDWSV
jgi:hypothetical protein